MHAKASALVLGILLGVSSQALATPFTFVDVEAGFNSDTATSPGPAFLSVTGTGIAGIGTATSTALADFGALGVSTSGSATPGPQTGGPTITSRAVAEFDDVLFVGGPDGAPVDVTVTLNMLGSCSASGAAGCIAQGSLAVPGSGVSVSSGGDGSSSVTFTWVGNSSFGIRAVFLATGSALDGSYDADFGHTLHTYVSSSTPGVVITSESGHDYSLPAAAPIATPEPATLVLLGTGVIAVARRRRRE
jgi:hypothetical protein